jgi:hypothetical protein
VDVDTLRVREDVMLCTVWCSGTWIYGGSIKIFCCVMCV